MAELKLEPIGIDAFGEVIRVNDKVAHREDASCAVSYRVVQVDPMSCLWVQTDAGRFAISAANVRKVPR